ncbi:glycosyl transferase [Bacillus coahuilensis p1.1.43]|uniref:Glycosyl transferase n=1 Tax=Bacillus coahuilensis p1.1.43 TaxID=1150625 RepID=A0A147K850_9BACI|nr:glycosyltransferase family 1 protein [Bacillus coahuilensis]KUP06381.1 glycosyl transferase [Bacillus coahuilensis p1.1.43]
MKILVITETFLPSTDGIVTRLTHSIRWLKDAGHEIIIVAPKLGVETFEGIKVVGIPAKKIPWYRSKKFAMPSRKIKKVMEDFGPDIVHVVNPVFIGAAGIFYAKKLKIKVVASYHTHVPKYADYYRIGMTKPILWWYFRLLHNQADLNLCTSQSVLKELNEQRFKNVHYWKRGVNTHQFGRHHRDIKWRQLVTNHSPTKKILLYVGRLAAEKEIHKIKRLLEKQDNIVLVIVGDGPERNDLEKLFQHESVVFTGFLHGEELAIAYASSDAFIFPSTTETLGLVILEAMASGTPVIAAKSGPTQEQIVDGVNGILFNPSDESSMDALLEKMYNEELMNRISMNAESEAKENGWSDQAAQLLGYYEQLILQKRKMST